MDIEKESLMLTSLLLCICVRHLFILCDFCFTFILRFPLATILIITWFPPCSGWRLPSSLLICTSIWNSTIKKRRNEMNNYRLVGVLCVLISRDNCLRNNYRTRVLCWDWCFWRYLSDTNCQKSSNFGRDTQNHLWLCLKRLQTVGVLPGKLVV